MGYLHALGGQKRLQTPHGQVRGLLKLLKNKLPVRIENNRTPATHSVRCDRSRGPRSLRPLHNRRNRNAKTGSDRSATFPGTNSSNNAFTQVVGIGLDH